MQHIRMPMHISIHVSGLFKGLICLNILPPESSAACIYSATALKCWRIWYSGLSFSPFKPRNTIPSGFIIISARIDVTWLWALDAIENVGDAEIFQGVAVLRHSTEMRNNLDKKGCAFFSPDEDRWDINVLRPQKVESQVYIPILQDSHTDVSDPLPILRHRPFSLEAPLLNSEELCAFLPPV
jgi:hypothetical protein